MIRTPLTLCLCLSLFAQDPHALPEDPVIRQWVLDVEEVFEAILEIRYWASHRRDEAPGTDEMLSRLEEVERVLSANDGLYVDTARLAAWLIHDKESLAAARLFERLGDGETARRIYEKAGEPLLAQGVPSGRPDLVRPEAPPGPSWRRGDEDPRDHLRLVRMLEQNARHRRDSFESFLGPLPDLPRVRRALALYYRRTGSGCAWSLADLKGDSALPTLLEMTALLDPDRFMWVLRRTVTWESICFGWNNKGFAKHGNATRLFRACFEHAPELRGPVGIHWKIGSRRSFPEHFLMPIALRRYLEDGAPIGDDFDRWLQGLLNGNSRERLCAYLASMDWSLVTPAPLPDAPAEVQLGFEWKRFLEWLNETR
ncbi:MAG: hypothetical protein RL885_24425 [Planctomycetota bacterium]